MIIDETTMQRDMERMKSIRFFEKKYQSLDTDDENGSEDVPAQKLQITSIVLALLIAVSAFIVGFLVGQMPKMSWGDSSDEFPGQLGNTKTVWHLNHTFASKPSPESEEAWQSIIPEGRGFITHPTLAPHNASLSVFHEIHCLHTIRVAYYLSLQENDLLKNSSSRDPYLDKIKARTDVTHVQHCFDYIRQALMCAADTNFERPKKGSGITDGWEIERQCRDYGAVVEWAERWRNNEGWTILSAEGQEGRKHKHEHGD